MLVIKKPILKIIEMKQALTIIIMGLFSFYSSSNLNSQTNTRQSIHKYNVKDIYGEDFKLSDLKGKKVMIVNTASRCGFTPQYKDLQKLYAEYKDSNFVIIGFPANNFLGQEPGTNEEIVQFCEANYGVDFPMMSKISVKGKDQHPIYEFLTTKSLNGVMDTKVLWNFQKYLIDEEGYLVMSVAPKTNPYDKRITDWLNN